MKTKFILFQFFLCFIFNKVHATTYYVCNSGDDSNAGTSPSQAWRTTARVSATTFRPGDKVLLAGGQSFKGGIWLRDASQGTATQPIVFRSYGEGRATIQSDDSYGFYAHNNAGIELRQLNFVGSGRLINKDSGVIFYLDSANAHLSHLRIDSLDVSGYQKAGVSVGSYNGESGYTDVRITNCQLHANGEVGLTSYARFPFIAHRNWYVGNVTAYDNSGRTDITNTHSGNGIMLSGINGALVEHCTAYHNGWLNGSPTGGPVGIWGWDCNDLTIQFCESHHNESGAGRDGGGFDLDGGCTNSVLQYNYSHDNDGPGYLLCQFDWAPEMHDLTVRYNISQNDARRLDQGAIMLYSSGWSGGIVRANIYNNTVYLSRPADGSSPKAVYVMSGGISDVTLRNNILQTTTGLPVLTTLTANGLRLEGNCYWTSAAATTFEWNGARYQTLSAWRAATGQEYLDGGTRPTGLCADPSLSVAGTSGTALLTSALSGFNPRPSSALMGVGLNLAAEFGIDPGTRDFFGNPTPALRVNGNVGASEAREALASSTAHKGVGAAWCQIYPTVVQNEIHVVSEQATAQPVEVRLFDLMGRQCRTWSRSAGQLQTGGLTLPATGLAPGQYILSVQSGSKVQRQSLLVAAQ